MGDTEFQKLFLHTWAAAARGVRVSLVLPSQSDSWPVFRVGRSHCAELLRKGVEVHEGRGAFAIGRGFAAQMEAMFAADVAASEQILHERWRRRPLLSRLKERLARVVAYWL